MFKTIQIENMNDQNNLKKHLLIFPAYETGASELVSFFKSLENMDLCHRLFIICPPEIFPLVPHQTQYCITDDFLSIPALITKITQWANQNHATFSGIMGVDEEEQFNISRQIASHFGLDFHELNTCSIASNKFLLKTFFTKHNVPTGKFALITDCDLPDEIDAIHSVGFPNVLKVLSGNGSAYLFKNENYNELREHFTFLKQEVSIIKDDSWFRKQQFSTGTQSITLDPKSQFLLEEFIPGQEFSCDFIKFQDHVQVIRIVKKFKGPYLGLFSGYLLLNQSDLEPNHIHLDDLTTVCKHIANAFSLKEGVCMMDFKIHDRQLSVIESSIRPGLSAFNHLMYEIYGYTSLSLMARQKIGLPIHIRFPQENGAIIYLYGPHQKGSLQVDTSRLEEAREQFGIDYIHIYQESGQSSIDPACDRSTLLKGYVLLKNIDPDQMNNLPEIAKLINEKVNYRM